METFLVVRTFWNSTGKMSNSQEEFATFDLAKKRAYTILGTDIGKDSVAYEIVTILSGTGTQMFLETVDNRPEPEPEPEPIEE